MYSARYASTGTHYDMGEIMIILAIDPGRTTGACAIKTNNGHKGFELLTALEIPWENRLELLEVLIDGTYFDQKVPQPPEAIVIENFRLRQGRAFEQSGSDFPSSQLIGAVQAFLWMDKPLLDQVVHVGRDGHAVRKYLLGPQERTRIYGLDRLHFQEPSCMSNVKIEPEHNDWVRGSEHKKDAYKHARFYYLAHVKELNHGRQTTQSIPARDSRPPQEDLEG